MRAHLIPAGLLAGLLLACSSDNGAFTYSLEADRYAGAKEPEPGEDFGAPPPPPAAEMMAQDALAEGVADEEASGAKRKRTEGRAGGLRADKDAGGGGDDGGAVATRSWFPETFLWAPRVITDDQGRASVPVTLPDSLTTWRILGLAGSREGAQAGAVALVDTRLPIYAEPRVPAFLRQGDRVLLPVQVFNTTAQPHTGALTVRAAGLDGGAAGTIAVPAGGTRLERVELSAPVPGSATVEVQLEGVDEVLRELEVLPRGRRTATSRSGVLGSSEAVTLSSPADSSYARVRLVLYPGPLGVLRDALAAAPLSLDTVDDRILAIALASRGGAVLEALGAAPDPEALRAARILATQGLVREVTGGDLLRQLTLLDGARRAAAEDPVLERITSWARDEAAAAQLPDGTWPVPGGAGVQRMLVLTAWAAEVLGDDRARVTAEGAFERSAAFLLEESTTDAYTAAMVLASGACPGELEEPLRATVAGALEQGADGLWSMSLPGGVVRPDGRPVTQAERLAVAARVLGDTERSRDLLASLVARYDPTRGFGDARAGLAALAAFEALAEAPPEGVLQVALSMDGELLGRRELDPRSEEVLVLTAPVPPGSHTFAVSAGEGVWPGLAWNLELAGWVPWRDEVAPGGLDVEVRHDEPALGRPLAIEVTASGPRGAWVEISQELPAGISVDPASLPAGASADDRAVRARLQVGQDGLARLRYTAIPGLGGTLWSGATAAAAGGLVAYSPPELWSVR